MELPSFASNVTTLSIAMSQEPCSIPIESTSKNDKTKTRFRCTFPGCGREFQLKGNLKRHGNIHKGDKQFACKFCKKRFLRKADMEVHYRVHTGEKPYRCKYHECGKCFARRSDLLSHERTHTGKKPYTCTFPDCDRRFSRRFDLQKHQRLHKDQKDDFETIITQKRKLVPCQIVPSIRNETCTCPNDVATPFGSETTSSDAASSATLLLSECSPTKASVPFTGAFAAYCHKMSTTTACVDIPAKLPRNELKRFEHDIDSPPASLAALSSLDAFLLSQESLDLSRPFSLDAFPPHYPSTTIGTSCCPAHLELRPPPPKDNTVSTRTKMPNAPDMLDQLLTTFPPGPNNTVLASRDIQDLERNAAGEMMFDNGIYTSLALPESIGASTMNHAVPESILPFSTLDADGLAYSSDKLLSMSTTSAASGCKTSVPSARANSSASSGTSVNFENVSFTDLNTSCTDAAPPDATQAKVAAEKACLSTPPSLLLDYSRHNRSCGHLSIQHGNHRDYVVQNHLVCQDSVTKLGVKESALSHEKTELGAADAKSVKCSSPDDTHRPGCGHLPVRHNDHIDYVVEDNLICQQASWLEDDNLELLGSDFWDFYGAIDAFPTN